MFSHPVYLFLREFSLQDFRGGSGLNRSILDQGWYEMRRQLEYKQLWRGGQVLAVPPAYTSQRC
ncbi:IS200/IS605 family element transposase accessory protein TnpB, partial [Escherichia coli]